MSDQELVIRQMDKIGEQAKRITALEAQIEAVKALPDTWENEADDRIGLDGFDCARQLRKALEKRK